MKNSGLKTFLFILAIVIAVLIAKQIFVRFQAKGNIASGNSKLRPAPVEVADITRGKITLRRTFSGSLEAGAEFVVATKVGGQIKRLLVDLADMVTRGQVVAELDNDEYAQAVAQAKADLAVARANLAKAKSALEIAKRDFERTRSLKKRGISSDARFDEALASQASVQAQLEVARAQVTRAEALLETANIRLGYTTVAVEWTSGDNQRIVAERFVDEGHTVSANTPLLRIVELDPITGVIFVSEKDYASMQPGQKADLTTDAYPGEIFEGRVARISPIFHQGTRQVRVELEVDNPRLRLKPGMFVRATVVFKSIPDATIVPETALTKRDGKTGIFIVSKDGKSVSWKAVKTGVPEKDRVQIMEKNLSGRVVTLGHQLVNDGSPVTIPGKNSNNSNTSGQAGAK